MAAGSARSFGEDAEAVAEEFLRGNGYKILHRNYRTRLGEIDLVAAEGGAVCFVEVKSRRTDAFGSPQGAVSGRKQERLRRAAAIYLARERLGNVDCRFDVVSVLPRSDGEGLQCELFRAAF